MSMTVQDVLDLPPLYEMTLRAGSQNLQNNVRWFYVAENEGIAEWIEGGELVFVTGINYVRDENNLLTLLEQAHQRKVAGLVVMTGEEFIHDIPASVIQRAEALGLPLIEQPYSLKMIEVTHIIGTRLVQLSQVKKSAEDVVTQLLMGDYPSLETIQLRAKHLELQVLGRHVIAVLKLSNIHALFHAAANAANESHFFKMKQQCYELLEQWRKQHAQSFPIIRQGDQFNMVLSLEQLNVDDWMKSLSALIQHMNSLDSELNVFAGLSNEVNSAVAFQRGFWEASQAQEIAADVQVDAGVCLYKDLGILKLLKAIPNKSVMQQFMQETLGMLMLNDKKHPYVLLETLDALLKENSNLAAAAQRLSIHRNTLNQRIQKIETLTGQSINSANFRLNASVALLIWQISHR
ncbi:PucR family transcriptional regulator [Acinetobacter bouvetii]|uniref:Purine catabolism regulatory protein n=1 Tax=Acinetobacter bouvetii TaxID=202951 RepID=A0A811G936_9GAMM|nr:PucR family transcriptional regulator [Acinetobacter bouvetii]CAB1211852.1 Purine catabolism regulatory protein [Acinetobacter bouvetii]